MGDKPTEKPKPDTFKQHYAGTSIAKRQLQEHDSIDNKKRTDNSDGEPNPMEMVNRWWEFVKNPNHSSAIIAILTLVIALSNIAYGWFSYRQMNIMRDSLGLSLAMERPWIGPNGHVISTLGPSQPPEGRPIDWKKNRLIKMELRIQNGGRAPATKFRWHMLWKIGDVYDAVNETASTPLPRDEVCDKGEMGSEYGAGVIMATPGVVTVLPVYVSQEILDRFEDVINNKVGLYVVGCLDYSDSTGAPWYRTKVRMTFIPKDSEPLGMTRFGNEAW
jgi:hypothetical protein